MGERVELGVELVDALDVGREPVVVEGSVMGEGEGGAAEVGEGEVELVSELGLGVGGVRFGFRCGLVDGGLAAGGLDVASECFEVEDLRVLAGGLAELAVELI